MTTGGLSADALGAAWESAGEGMVNELGGEVKAGWAVFGTDCDVLFVGSKAGALTHDGAAHVAASAVVPIGPIPVTTKAFAVLRRAGVAVLPDFVCLAGPLLAVAEGGDASADQLRDLTRSRIAASLDEVIGHDDGPLLGAAYRAEAFLGSWQDTLPFGRPIA
jgi:glutamate dehydrogenase/leucine dehydrogenase